MLMTDMQAHDDHSDHLPNIFAAPPINPLEEMYAYEALWSHNGASFSTLAKLFEQNPGKVPSELVLPSEIDSAAEKLTSLLGKRALQQIGIRVHGAFEYPQKLRQADNPLELLYFLGDWELVSTPGVAIVGTRKPSPEAVANAHRIAGSLARSGYTVVSGLAAGIDTAAHTGAIEAGGKTIAVLGTPLNEIYPKENRDLQELIANKHLLISQVPFLRYRDQIWKTNRFFFPARNITMSALTIATVIVEAGETSGTLVQARAAMAQGRKLIILDNCFRSGLAWPAKFEKLGAIRVRDVSEIKGALKHAQIPENRSASMPIP
jgi:DNA processing protein